MGRVSQAVTLALLLGVPFTSGCARDDRPNIVLVTLDTTRADRLGAYGDLNARTPVLDGLAARGTLFERAYSSVPLTLPAHTTLLTGQSPAKHGAHDNSRFIAPEALDTLAERLKASGYATGAFVSALVLDSSFGLDQGFDVYSDETQIDEDPLNFLVPQRPGEETTDAALAWLSAKRRQPFFLWTHYYDPHEPRVPHAPFAEEMDDPYAAAIAYMDAQLGRLLSGVQKAAGDRATVILVVADHGESLGEHHETSHGIVAYDSTLHVPLIVVGPGFEPGSRSESFVTIEDVTPTLLVAAGEAPTVGSDGIPLQTQLTNPHLEERVTAFECFGPYYAYGWAPIAGVRTSRWKYTAQPNPPELYDVLADPGELNNLIEDQPEVVARLASLYEARNPHEQVATTTTGIALDPEIEAQLAALGYLSVPQQFAPEDAPDPRKAVALFGWVGRAQEVARSGRLADGIEALTILTEEPSISAVAWRSLGILYEAAGHRSKAIEAFQALLALSDEMEVRIRLANLLLAEGQPNEALAMLSQAPARPTGEPPVLTLARGEVLLALGRYEEAQEAASQVLARDATRDAALALASRARAAQEGRVEAEITALQRLLEQPPAGAGPLSEVRLALADYLRSEGRDAEAVSVLEAAEHPTPTQLIMLAQIAVAQGDGAKAATLYESVLERIPMADDTRRELADLYDALGRSEEAIPLYDQLIAVSPEDATLRVDRGTTLFRLGRFTEAEDDFRTAIGQNDQIPEAHFNLALLDLKAKRYAEAETQLKRAIELRPDFAKAHYHLANLYRMRGDPRAAYHAEQAIQLSSQLANTSPMPSASSQSNPPKANAPSTPSDPSGPGDHAHP